MSRDNVFFEQFDKDGNRKKLFQHNWLGKLLFKLGHDLQRFPFGSWVDQRQGANLITTVGKAAIADLVGGVNSIAVFDYMALGTGTTAAAAGDTALETEITDSGLERAQGTPTLVTTDTANDTLQVVYQWTASGSKAITEAGLLNAAAAGTLLAHQVFSAINVTSSDTVQITWKIDID